MTGKARAGDFHVPQWPARHHGNVTERILCYRDRGGTVYAEPGAGFAPLLIAEWDAYTDLLFSWDALVWEAGNLGQALHAFWAAILGETKESREARPLRSKQWCEVWLGGEQNEPAVVTVHRTIRGHAQQRHIASMDKWLKPEQYPTDAKGVAGVLSELRWLFDRCEVGVHPTPAGTGTAMASRVWAMHPEWKRWSRPPRDCVAAMAQHGIGGRMECYQERSTWDALYEVDRNGAYLAEAGRVPGGGTHIIPQSGLFNIGQSPAYKALCPLEAPELQTATWFARCLVRIGERLDGKPLPAGWLPFAVRAPTPDDPSRIQWPTEPGLYPCWLWREEAEAIRSCQLSGDPIEIVTIDGAFYWTEWSTQLEPWRDSVQAIRNEAKASGHKIAAGMAKLCGVSAIGRMRMPYERRSLVPYQEAKPGDTPWMPAAIPDSHWLVRTEDEDHGAPAHVALYVWMKSNLWLWQLNREEAARGNPAVVSHIDASFFAHKPANQHYSWSGALGESKLTLHTPMRVIGVGAWFSPQAQAAQGVPVVLRKRLLRTGEQEKPPWQMMPREQERHLARKASHDVFLRQVARFERIVFRESG